MQHVLATDADIRSRLPGGILYNNDTVFVSAAAKRVEHDLQIGPVDPLSGGTEVRLAIAGMDEEGRYGLGNIRE